jgi:hypothetical protein
MNQEASGHSYAFCKSPIDKKWRSFNDEIVQEI